MCHWSRKNEEKGATVRLFPRVVTRSLLPESKSDSKIDFWIWTKLRSLPSLPHYLPTGCQ